MNDSSDFLWGAAAIAKAIGRTARQTYHLLESGHLPANRVGNRWVASRQRLRCAALGDERPSVSSKPDLAP
jgi:hypothetical protein